MRSSLKIIVIALLLSSFALTGRVLADSPTASTSSVIDADASGASKLCNGDPNCYQLLAPLPLGGQSGTGPIDASNPDTTTNPTGYIAGIINLIVALVGAFTVLRLIVAGFQYVVTENFSKKSSARSTMNSAIIGLLLTIGAFTILQTIGQFNSGGNSVFTDLGLTITPIKETNPLEATSTCLGPVVNGVCTSSPGLSTTTPAFGGNTGVTGCASSCVPVTNYSFPSKSPGGSCIPDSTCGGYACSASVCYLSSTLASELDDLAKNKMPKDVTWQVSEMFPPTITHNSTCHMPGNPNSGTCADLVLANASYDQAMGEFLAALKSEFGSNFEYEIGAGSGQDCGANQPRLVHLQNVFPYSKYGYKFTCEPKATGENAHVNQS